MNKSYKEIQAEIAKLQAEAESVRKNELAKVIAQIRETMSEYGITVQDLADGKVSRRPAEVKYRDPLTGEGWSGRGRVPRWLVRAEAEGRKREEFAVR